MAATAQPLFDAVLAFLAEKDIEGTREGDATVARLDGKGKNGEWMLHVSTDEDSERCTVYSVGPFTVDAPRRAAVMELFNRINFQLEIGNYDFDLDSGDLAFRTSIDVEGDRLSAALVAQLVAANVAAFDTYLPALEAVAQSDAEPVAALAAIGR